MEADDETTSVTMIDDEIYSNGGGDGEEKRSKPNLSSELLDVEVYASLYSGRTKVTRLIFIADRCQDKEMKYKALRIAYEEIKKGENTNLFKEVVEKIDGKLGEEYGLDQAWVDNVDRKADVRKEKLESELNAYREETTPESVRRCYIDLGDFYYSRGKLKEALGSYISTQEYCSTPQHILEMCLNAIFISIQMGKLSLVATYVSRAERLEALSPGTTAKLCCAAGLFHLENKKYGLAAQKFIETGEELGNAYVIAPEDIAVYGALCALASFGRAELKNQLLNKITFCNLLKLVPEVKEVVDDFFSCQYGISLANLNNMKHNLVLDIHLNDHVEALYSNIRSQALIQYTDQFEYVNLCSMASIFRTDVSGLESELVPLITEYQKQLTELYSAASVEVSNCKSLVKEYENALEADEYLQDSSRVQFDLKLKHLEMGDVTSKMRGKKNKGKRHSQWQKSHISDQVNRLSSELAELEKFTHRARKDLDEDQLRSLLSSAESTYKNSKKEHSAMKKRLFSFLNKKFGCITAEPQRHEVYVIKDGRKVAA